MLRPPHQFDGQNDSSTSPRRRLAGTSVSYGMPEKAMASNGDAASLRDSIGTNLYKKAAAGKWEDVAIECEKIRILHKKPPPYVCPENGTCALHLAVMSRVGYSISDDDFQKRAERPVPLKTLQNLLEIYPQAAEIRDSKNGYTPLHYACLVPAEDEDYCLEDADLLVRLILKMGGNGEAKPSLVLTKGGLTALDVHIVSYSQAMAGKQDSTHLSGRTSTVVLRTLLENDPSLAEVRISGDAVGGPIEILYRCNSQAFSKLASQYENKQERTPDRAKPRTIEDKSRSKAVIANITSWWVWTWTVLILKYGTLPHKKKGARFYALQAASGLVGCPLPILTLALHAFPSQISEIDQMHGNDDGNLPLHEVCSWPCEQDSASADPVISSRKGMAISALLQEYPDAAFIRNRHGRTPLDLAIASGTTWDGGVRKLVRANPGAISVENIVIAAASASHGAETLQPPLSSTKRSLMTHLKNMAKKDLQQLRTIYGLIRRSPKTIAGAATVPSSSQGTDQEIGWADFDNL